MKIDWKTFKIHYTRPKKGLFPTGSRVYKGYQGSGKTLSMVKYALDIHKKFPDALIFSNVHIKGIDENHYMYIENDEILKYALEVQKHEHTSLALLNFQSIF